MSPRGEGQRWQRRTAPPEAKLPDLLGQPAELNHVTPRRRWPEDPAPPSSPTVLPPGMQVPPQSPPDGPLDALGAAYKLWVQRGRWPGLDTLSRQAQ